jgi:hypothetical protein
MHRATHFRQRSQKVDAQHGSALGLKLAHRESLALVSSLKGRLVDQKSRALQREAAMKTALMIAKEVIVHRLTGCHLPSSPSCKLRRRLLHFDIN